MSDQTILFNVVNKLLVFRGQYLNNFIREENQEKKLDKKETTSNVVSYHNESKSIISGGEVSNQYKNSFGKLIDEFYTYCINHQPEQAYELLSSETFLLLSALLKQGYS